ncbi:MULTISPECIES: 2-oxoacid:ferredoxin oxidoreductase subunit beta [unclassified Lentimicrobium]|uniref:2-oxoacid:ferredoxin oxidoreductase subunit beta n=1 Tax=unclassified Lentimicrobium TaxID=2677434 RepID=UPI00155684E2|nr:MULTISPECIES: 2-oxoacid:ferredoxin oxidoreductase subunit beta [unclassified Lentimicrobium]NPD45218.1 2-oxoacid:ferredoxin oxidoreductase subunit beta [Lentimicrobium sp. S6]NPD85397.1 2-oxoacid:ferredoxin oxidoreductase subunit beta [Lentimicrobium sp. L6]
MATQETVKLTFKDFKSDQEVRWCAGCGDHAILNSVHKTLAAIGKPRENYTIISGIGCSSRFPYYMNTYAFHTIHGRALAIASGTKTANPDLSVWVITGDGDGLAIGGNHFIHAIRRNINMNVLLFNNEIYGLTKGQYSPTTQEGLVTKTSPNGSIEHPFNPGELVLGSNGHYFARSIDVSMKLTNEILENAEAHNGTSIVEILQNCVIFNDKTHGYYTDKAEKLDRQIILRHGEKMIFGKENDKGLILDGMKLKVVKIGEDGISEDDILVHDAHEESPFLHWMLIRMKGPEFPIALGVIRETEGTTYGDKMEAQVAERKEKSSIKTMNDLLHSGATWQVD